MHIYRNRIVIIYYFSLFIFSTCRDKDLITNPTSNYFNFQLLDTLKAKFNFIKVPSSLNYNIEDSISSKDFRISIYKFSDKRNREGLNSIFCIKDLLCNRIYVIPDISSYLDKYYAHLMPADLYLYNGFINQNYYKLHLRDLEEFYNIRYQNTDIDFIRLIKLNEFVLQFYLKDKISLVNKIDSISEIDSYFDAKFKEFKENENIEIRILKDFMKEKLVDENSFTTIIGDHVLFFQLYRDLNDTLNRQLVLDFKHTNLDCFHLKDLVKKKQE